MLQTSQQAAKTTDLFDLLSDGAAALSTSIQRRRQAAHDRDTLAELTDAQLFDAGIDRWSIHQPRPSMQVEAGLMTKLMSMR
ncbi:MAG: hypothetical protein ACKVP3_13200 [Hyphomicrobiaceae bacterium]